MKRIANRYQMQEEIGQGGMGTVYRGIDTHTEQTVAIKHLKPDVATPEMLARFRSEGEALRDLNHPNMVKMLAMIEEEDAHYLILEYIGGGDLGQLLANETLPVQHTLQIALDLADALTRAHRLNIVHRDIKPANVLLADDGTPRLTDFGIAHIEKAETITEAGTAMGTLDYLPPEAFTGETVDLKADIWAFGVMLFEMIAGQRPFLGDTPAILLNNILREPPPFLEDLVPETPIALVDLIYRMLEKDPQARIPSVRIIGAELEAILQGRVTESRQRFNTPASEIKYSVTHNLPADATPFVGRETEISEISALLDDPSVRLVTIIAQGGMGKTRLSLQAGQDYLEKHNQGVFLVELAPLTDAGSIIPAIADATGYAFQNDGRSPKQQVLDYLASREMLLILDNYEHLLDGVTIATDILQAAPQVKILVTSRQRLGQPGETLFHLIGMEFPETIDYATAAQYSAVKLFANSARRAQPQFLLDESNMEIVVQICKTVQGMPLGIVLAASWLAMLSLDEIVLELQQGMDILEADDGGDIPERQKSIRAVMDYSWQHMNPREQETLMQLAVFRGGFTREAAQTVAGANLRVLMSLVTKSLVRRDKQSGRYSIHELLRQYAEEQLVKSQHENETTSKHARYYADFLGQLLPLLKGGGQLEALANIEPETGNIYLAWKNASELQLADTILQMLQPFFLYTVFRSREVQLVELLSYTRKYNPQPDTRLEGYCLAYMPHDDSQVVDHLKQAIAIGEAHEDVALVAFAKRQLGIQLAHRQRLGSDHMQTGIDLLEESLAIYRQLEDRYFEAFLLDDIAFARLMNMDSDSHKIYVHKARSIRNEIGDIFGISNGTRGITLSQERLTEAITTLQEGLVMSETIGNSFNAAWLHAMLVERYNLTGDTSTSRYHLQRSNEINETINNHELREINRFSEAILTLLESGNVDVASNIIFSIVPEDEIDNVTVQSSVGFYTVIALGFLYSFKEDAQTLRRVLPQVMSIAQMNIQYLHWYIPLLAPLFYDSDPQQAFVYLHFSYENQDLGSAWMTKSPQFMQKYDTLRAQFPREKFPDLYAQAENRDARAFQAELDALTNR